MRKRVLIFLLPTFFLSGCSIQQQLTDTFTPGALTVESQPKAEVFLDNKSIGTTPIQNKRLKPGSYNVLLKSDFGTWIDQVQVRASTVTIISRELSPIVSLNGGYVASLERGQGITVIGNPQNAAVTVDKGAIGSIPVSVNQASAGLHEVTITAEGYESRSLQARITQGFKLIINVDLVKKEDRAGLVILYDPKKIEKPDIAQTSTSHTPSASISPSPSSSVLVSPKPNTTPVTPQATTNSVRVKYTGTGWLRIRAQPSSAAKELFKVDVGAILESLGTRSSWTQVRTQDGREGWASSTYLEKV